MEQLITQIENYIPFNEQEVRDKAQILGFLRSGAELITRENPVAHMTASAWVVSPDRKQVIMVYHNLYQSWSWMGGHADGDWDLLRVAKKEVMQARRGNWKKWGVVAASAAFAVTLMVPQGRLWLRDLILPGDEDVTAAALEGIVSDLRSGEPLGEAVDTFCKEILAGGT